MNNQLIDITTTSKGIKAVRAKDLYRGLGLGKSDYSNWVKRIKSNPAYVENEDYIQVSAKSDPTSVFLQSIGEGETELILSLDAAKHESMKSKSKRAHEFRQYFIDVEKEFRKGIDFSDPNYILQLAQNFKAEHDKRIAAEEKLKAQRPKVLFANAVSASKTSILIGELAKLIKQNGVEMGQNRLFNWLREKNYLISRKGSDFNSPTQKSMELGLFEVKETAITHSDGHVSISKTSKVTGKGQVYFIEKFLKANMQLTLAN